MPASDHAPRSAEPGWNHEYNRRNRHRNNWYNWHRRKLQHGFRQRNHDGIHKAKRPLKHSLQKISCRSEEAARHHRSASSFFLYKTAALAAVCLSSRRSTYSFIFGRKISEAR